MIPISKAKFNTLDRDFSRFQTRITSSKKQDIPYFVSQMNRFEKRYKQAGLESSFVSSIFEFADRMQNIGIADLPGIIYSSLMKMPFITPQAKEIYALKGLEYANNNGDSIHALARLVDLEKLYKMEGNTHKRTRVLFRQEKVLTNICNDFKSATRNFNTVSKEHNQLKHYEMELAKTRVEIAKVILKSNPQKATIILNKALKIFERENRQKEVDFINLMLSEIAS